MNKKLYALTALFDTPDQIMEAAGKVQSEGYEKYDVHTPYPVHGMDHKMKLKPSTMGYFALAFGLTGTFIAMALITYTMVFDYPLVIGGKPFFALPAFIPVTFELTVLLATMGTVVGMLFVFFKFPHNSHPLHDSEYMKSVSSDKYGVCIESEDPKFDFDKVKEFLIGLGSKDIQEVYHDDTEEPKLITRKFIYFLIGVFFVVSGGTYFALNKLLLMEPFNWMAYQDRVDAQSASDFFEDGFSMRPPVEGSVPRDYIPYEFKGNPEGANNLINPLPMNEENVALGKKKFLTYCSPCHGNYGNGESRLNNNFPIPPTLHSKKVRTWPDGRIYHVITDGQAIMPSYEKQVTRKERWAIVNYIRSLQRAFNPKEEDFNE